PVIDCIPGHRTVECGYPWDFVEPKVSDACCRADVTLIVLNTVTNGQGCSQTITRTWLATDCCGNTNSCSQTVSLIDTAPPVFSSYCTNYHYEAGTTTDNFVGPEPDSPSAPLLARIGGSTKGFDDCTVNSWVA